MSRKVLRGAGLLAAILVVACGSEETTRFESLDDALRVESGEAFEIALDANSSTGYEWRLTDAPAPEVVRYEGSDYVPDPGSEDQAGGGGEQILRFEALEEGEATINLEYVFTGGEERRAAATRMSATVIVR